MRWIVGLDLREHSRGAIKTAPWLNHAGPDTERHRFFGVHVVPHRARVSARDDELDELCEQARVEAETAVVEAGTREVFDRIEVVPGAAVKALAAASTYYDVDGLIIGRHGPRAGGTVVRLGTVARQLLRQLPAAVMVVPPDADPATRTLGPVPPESMVRVPS